MNPVEIVSDPEPALLEKFPFPYRAAFSVSSDIDSASVARFRAVHAMFCSNNPVRESSPSWEALGLSTASTHFREAVGGVPGLGLEFGDSFFLIADPTTFGMHRYDPTQKDFQEDHQDDECCSTLIWDGLRRQKIDTFHAFLHYPRSQVEPLLRRFYTECARQNIPPPKVWVNHSTAATPTGLCPDRLQSSVPYRLTRLGIRYLIGPMLGRRRQPLRNAFVRYRGDTPGSAYYINDLLAANGLRYVWLNVNDLCRDQTALSEEHLNGRSTILHPITMDDGVRYWRFDRCCLGRSENVHGEAYLRDSPEGYDASRWITSQRLAELCRLQGTCILYTHWTHHRSMPISDETISRFELLRQWRDLGKVWVTSTSRLLDWTRLRTFIRIAAHREGRRLILNIQGIDDPLYGFEALQLKDVDGLCVRLRQVEPSVVWAINGRPLSPEFVSRSGDFCWLHSRAPIGNGGLGTDGTHQSGTMHR